MSHAAKERGRVDERHEASRALNAPDITVEKELPRTPLADWKPSTTLKRAKSARFRDRPGPLAL